MLINYIAQFCSFGISLRIPPPLPRYIALYRTFSPTVWACVLGALLAATLALTLLSVLAKRAESAEGTAKSNITKEDNYANILHNFIATYKVSHVI